jgi:hypothetical protein
LPHYSFLYGAIYFTPNPGNNPDQKTGIVTNSQVFTKPTTNRIKKLSALPVKLAEKLVSRWGIVKYYSR